MHLGTMGALSSNELFPWLWSNGSNPLIPTTGRVVQSWAELCRIERLIWAEALLIFAMEESESGFREVAERQAQSFDNSNNTDETEP